MPPVGAKKPPAAPSLDEFEVDRDRHTIRFIRTLAAAPETVFAAWTEPEHVKNWWDPSGEELARCEIDLRPDGAFTFVNHGPAGVPPFSGVYREVAPPTRLVFEAMGSIGTVAIARVSGGSMLTVSIACPSAEALEHFLRMGVATGTVQTLSNLTTYLGTLE